jgi:signal transduction histidine kinase
VIRQVIEELRLANPSVKIDQNLDLDGAYACDPDRIAQMVSNLVGNAVKHGDPRQPIRVTGSATARSIRLEVENGGQPIPEEALAKLFEPFSRTDGQGGHQGLGLGLFIARQIALGHGGDITVSSDSDRTVFTFEMPVEDMRRGPIQLAHWA